MKPFQKKIAFGLLLASLSGQSNALTINATFDSNWLTSAPPAATAAVNLVTAMFGSLFSNPGTVNITFGWGDINGSVLPSNALGATTNVFVNNSLYPLSTVSNLLTAYSSSHPSNAVMASVVQNLPASVTNPGGQALFAISQAQYTALTGYGNFTSPDAYIGFGTGVNWQYSQTGGIASNAYDFVGTALHEVAHALGRVNYEFNNPTPYLTPFDLTRYTCKTKTLNDTSGTTACFSINGGVTDLATFSATSDTADWAGTSGTSGDAFGAYLAPGMTATMTPVDYTVMQALGWTIPEPGTIFLFGASFLGLAFLKRKSFRA